MLQPAPHAAAREVREGVGALGESGKDFGASGFFFSVVSPGEKKGSAQPDGPDRSAKVPESGVWLLRIQDWLCSLTKMGGK